MTGFYDKRRLPSNIDPGVITEAISKPILDSVAVSESMGGAEQQGTNHESPEGLAAARFKSCRWHKSNDAGASFCFHRDVLPFAGKNGFSPAAWCPECSFYKVKRTVRKQSVED